MQLPNRGLQLQNRSCNLSQPGATVHFRGSRRPPHAVQHACPAPLCRHQEQQLRLAVWQAARSRVARAAGAPLLCPQESMREDRETSGGLHYQLLLDLVCLCSRGKGGKCCMWGQVLAHACRGSCCNRPHVLLPYCRCCRGACREH